MPTGPIAYDLFCVLGGWTEGLLAAGWRVIGFDIERHVYGEHRYPAELVLQDILTLHGSQLRHAGLIVASPPCQRYSYMAMPWTRAKDQIKWYSDPEHPERIGELNALFDACFRIQREANEAANPAVGLCESGFSCQLPAITRGHFGILSCGKCSEYAWRTYGPPVNEREYRYIPLVVENVKGAQPWVGRSRWHYGSYYLWGDVPALMPHTLGAAKVSGFRFDGSGRSLKTAACGLKTTGTAHKRDALKVGGDWFGRGDDCSPMRMREEDYQRRVGELNDPDAGVKQHGSGRTWFDQGIAALPSGSRKRREGDSFGCPAEIPLRNNSSHSHSRKAASAQIAKIPFPLAYHIGMVYRQEVAA